MQFPAVEVQLKKWKETTNQQQLEGRWVTRRYLMTSEGWTQRLAFMLMHSCFRVVLRKMADNAYAGSPANQ